MTRAWVVSLIASLLGCSSQTAAPVAPTTPGSARPPARPVAKSTGSERWFVMSRIRFGYTDPSTDRPDAFAWRQYGYDLDRVATTAEESATSAGSCKRVQGSAKGTLEDGDDGRDDNFGHYVMPVARSLEAEIEPIANAAIADGSSPTLVIHLWNVGPDDNGSVPGEIFSTATTSFAPRFDDTDHFPLDELAVADDGSALAQFPRGYMANGVWVSGEKDLFTIRLPFARQGYPFVLRMEGFVTFDTRTGGDGTIAGAMPRVALEKAALPLLSLTGTCPGNATFDQIIQTMTQSADLVVDAPNFQNTEIECNAISVGIGFEVKPTGLPGPKEHALEFGSKCP